jgi:protein-S-isoprenylcysteine O-methyltransferase Ste14
MLWMQGILFTLLVEGLIVIVIPYTLNGGGALGEGLWRLGWIPIGFGAAMYASCLMSFLRAGGTPALFFTRPFKSIIGEEPPGLVRNRLYGFSRNPIYGSVILTIAGEAIIFASAAIAIYALVLWAIFHAIIVTYEEPHLRAKQGQDYENYCRHVPRWLGRRTGLI